MKIRSVTFFLHPEWPLAEDLLDEAGRFIQAAHPAFSAAGFDIQSFRLATISFAKIIPAQEIGVALSLAQELEHRAAEAGFGYISLGPALPKFPGSYDLIPDLLAGTKNAFFSAKMNTLNTQDNRVSLPAVRACAAIIHQAASITPDGFTNLRFAALANVPSGSPFFPAAYHSGRPPAFAVATEAAGLALEAIQAANSLEAARQNLIMEMERQALRITEVARTLEEAFAIPFGGVDFSLAPFPDEAVSLGGALERLGLTHLGSHGSLAAAAFLADTIDRARFQRAGFSGLMLPVLEDTVLARRAAEGALSVKDLLLFSAVCGTGLDTVPLPGSVTEAELEAVLLDVAALALRLDKPLTARLMPIPGKAAGDPTEFDFSYFANSRVMPLQPSGLNGLLAGTEIFDLKPRVRGE